MRAVDWPMLRDQHIPEDERPRERKKRLLRRRLSDTATRMFLERGFDAVRVTEIAEACGVTEKTVYNYFPTKESLILDLWESTAASLRTLADPTLPPLQAALAILSGELTALTSWMSAQDDQGHAAELILRFGALLRSTPALQAYQREAADRLIAAAAQALAERAGVAQDAPEPRIAAIALIGLWQIQFQSLGRHLAAGLTPAQLRDAVNADVHRAATVLDTGL
ncbi:TetR/AcrR family transcriptional regulator [Microbispora corallina]|uniref:TetR family transcriptional regulator n=1 Tax=Microbispora corallina TaxID=83302 RepID=A0ABQ4G9X0_9ACTN|nr:TetR/AcrR family transcriptional regulator [Microbispora corallina]GIH43876.1 TetR family transcriptional regulator [Microbispora corallina]